MATRATPAGPGTASIDRPDFASMALNADQLAELIVDHGECILIWTTRQGQNRRSATFKGTAIIHCPGDADWPDLSNWFYPALSGTEQDPHSTLARGLQRSLDTPAQVIIEVRAGLMVSFGFATLGAADASRHRAKHPRAWQAGGAVTGAMESAAPPGRAGTSLPVAPGNLPPRVVGQARLTRTVDGSAGR
jgi:hypothetical protein